MAVSSSPKSNSPSTGPALIPLGEYAHYGPIALKRPVMLIGSRSNAHIHLTSRSVSKAHALLVQSRSGTYIRDLMSREHVYVNGDQVREVMLNDGDLVKIGKFTFKYQSARVRLKPEADPGPAKIEVTGGEMPIPIEERVVLIGRRPGSDIALLEESVSTAHAVIFQMNGDRFIRDLGSRTGTRVNGKKIHQQELEPGDTIEIGETTMRYRPGAEAPALTESAEESAIAVVSSEEPDLGLDLDIEGPIAVEPTAPEIDDLLAPETAAQEPAPEVEGLELEHLDAEEQKPAAPSHDDTAAIPLVLKPEAEAEAPEVEKTSAPEQPAESPLSTEIAGEPDELLADAGLELEKLRDEKASAETTPEATDVVESAKAPAASDASAAESIESVLDDVLDTTPAEPVAPVDEATSESTKPVEAKRRGWRAIAPEVPAEEIPVAASDEAPAAKAEPQQPEAQQPEGEQPEQPAQTASDDSVFRFSDPVESSTSADDAATATLDQDTLGATASPEAPAPLELPAPDVTPEEDATDLGLSSELLDLASPAQRHDEPPAAQEYSELETVDFSRLQEKPKEPEEEAAEPSAEAEAPAPLETRLVDLSTPEAPVIEDEKPAQDEPIRPLIAADAIELAPPEPVAPPPPVTPITAAPIVAESPAIEPQVVEEPKLTRKGKKEKKPKAPKRGRKKGAVEETPEIIAEAPVVAPIAEATPEVTQTVAAEAAEAPAPEMIEAPAAPLSADEIVEVLDQTEPTPESALTLENADESAASVGEMTSTDGLTDTSFGRAVEEFTSEATGPIVEQQAIEETPVEPSLDSLDLSSLETEALREDAGEDQAVAEAPSAEEPVAEAPAVEEAAPQAEQPEPEQPIAPTPMPFSWGANQDHFLGGSAVDLRKPAQEPIEEPIDDTLHAIAPSADDEVADIVAPPVPVVEAPLDEAIAENVLTDAAEAAVTEDETAPTALTAPVDEAPAVEPEAPTATPAAQDEDEEPIEMPRPKPRKPTLIKNFGRNQQAEPVIPPFAGASGEASIGFEALANAPVREDDVFSQPSPEYDEEELLRGTSPLTPMDMVRPPESEQHPESLTGISRAATPTEDWKPSDEQPDDAIRETDRARAARERRGISPDAFAPRRPSVSYSDQDEAEISPDVIRRARLRRVPILLIAMLILIAGSSFAIYNYWPVRTNIEAAVPFRFPDGLTTHELHIFQKEQRDTLSSDVTRQTALGRLQTLNPKLPGGFLADLVAYDKSFASNGAAADWPESRKGVFAIHYTGADEVGDPVRMQALAWAIFDTNRPLLSEAVRTRHDIDDLKSSIATKQATLADLTQKIQKERDFGDAAGNVQQQELDLRDQVTKLDKAWSDARAAVKNAEADLAQLQNELKSTPTTAPSTKVDPANDEQLSQMSKQLGELSAKIAATKDSQAEQAAEARKGLDSAMDDFQKQITAAQNSMKDNPQLKAYVEAAQKLQESTRSLIDELIQRQQKSLGSLMEMKQRFNEKMDSKRNETWANDEELKSLHERYEITQRQYNAAVASKLKKDADQLKAELDLVNSLIKSRQELLGNDPLYADAIAQLQLAIDTQQKDIEADRKRTDEMLEDQQKDFAQLTPSVEKLPAEQKQLAEDLGKKLAAINEARKNYSQAIDDSQAKAQEAMADMQKQRNELQTQIEARRAALASANQQTLAQQNDQLLAQRKAAVDAKQKELAGLTKAESDARAALDAKEKEHRAAMASVEEVQASGERLVKDTNDKDAIDHLLKEKQDELEAKTAQLARMVEPIEPTEADVRILGKDDPRLKYMLGSGGAILVLFTFWILLTLHGANRDALYYGYAPDQYESVEKALPVNGNGNGNGKHATTEDEREPAVV